MDILDLLEHQAVPVEEHSRWYCDRAVCDGEPHGDHWRWCDHSCDAPWDSDAKVCARSCGMAKKDHHDPSCRHARSAQVPPGEDWFIWLLISGRGFGKSRAAAEWLVDRARRSEPAEWGVVARSSADVRKNARDMHAGLVAVAGGLVEHGGHVKQYNRHEEDIYLDNGAIIHCLSADKPDKLRGYNLAGAWADELASWRYPEAWDLLLMALREGSHTQMAVTTTPKPTKLLKALVDRVDGQSYRITTGSTWDNAKNLAANFIAEMRSAYEGTRLGRQELLGELLFDVAGALVTAEMIDAGRLARADAEDLIANLARIVVAIDPATGYGENADETGIVVCAKDRDGHGYVLDDLSCAKRRPKEWATIAVAAYERWGADRIIAEKNQGGAMVEETIRSVAPHIPYTGVSALVSKRLRAEPIAALYEQGRIHHVGDFPELESQLVTWEPDSKMKSPDRMDAMVHGMTELGLGRWGQGFAFLQIWQEAVKKETEEPSRPGGFSPRALLTHAPEVRPCRTKRIFGPEARCANCGRSDKDHQ